MSARDSRRELATLLIRTRECVEQSADSNWPGLSLVTLSMELNVAIENLNQNRPINDDQLRLYFAPNGPLQQIAMMSGWTDRYAEFATRFDALIGRV